MILFLVSALKRVHAASKKQQKGKTLGTPFSKCGQRFISITFLLDWKQIYLEIC